MEKSNLYKKLAQARGEIGKVEKKGRIEASYANYRYQTIEDIISAVRPALMKYGLVILPLRFKEIDTEIIEGKTTKQRLVKISAVFRIASEDGEFIDVEVEGDGMDTGDKAKPKAYSMAVKYLFKVLFNIEAGEDDYDKDVSPKTIKKVKTSSDEPATEAQKKKIRALMVELHGGIPAEYKEKIEGLTKAEASKVIDKLLAKLNEKVQK